MVKKKSYSLLFLLAITQIAITSTDLLDEKESDSEIFRKKGCEKFCCINVTGNETIGGDLTVGGNLTVNGQSNAGVITVSEDIIVNEESVAALFNFGSFYFEQEVTRATPVTIAPGQSIPFPTVGAGTTVVAGSGHTQFIIPTPGTWIISWTVNFTNATGTQPTGLALFVQGTKVTGSTTKTQQLSGQMSNTILTNIFSANNIVELKNTGATTFTLTQGSISIRYNSGVVTQPPQ